MLASYPANRLHNQHPPPPTSNRSRQPTGHNSGGQFWTPIPKLRGSKLHAETQPAFDFGGGRYHEATDRGLVPPRHAAAAREAGSQRIVYRRAGSDRGEDSDRRGGRAPALADLEW